MINKKINIITERIIHRSKISRKKYLSQMKSLFSEDFSRTRLSCGNLAHGFAGCNKKKNNLSKNKVPNIGIITAYNDMLSYKTYEDYPKKIRKMLKNSIRGSGFDGVPTWRQITQVNHGASQC